MKDSRSLFLIVILTLLQFLPAIWSGGVLLPLDILYHLNPFATSIPGELLQVRNPHLSDLVIQFYPWLDFLRTGGTALSLWNPYSFCGSPMIANGQTTFLHPLTWLNFVLPVAPATLSIALGKLLFCGAFAFLFYRKLGLEGPASLIGSLAYMFGGHLTAWLGYPGSYPIVTLPFLFWSLENYLSRPSLKGISPIALAYGLLFIAGQPQTGAVVAAASLLYFIIRVRVERPPLSRTVLHFSVAATVGFCLASPQILPFLEYLRESAAFHLRSSLGWKQYPWFTLISCAVPRFFGDLRTGNFWGFSSHLGEAVYIGVVPLTLASVGVVLWRRSRQFWAVTSVLFLGFLGLYVVPAQRALSHVPLLSQLDNNKLLVLITFGLTSLAAGGLNEILSSSRLATWKLWMRAEIFWTGFVLSGLLYFRTPIHELSLMRFELGELAWCGVVLILSSGSLWAYRVKRVGPTQLAVVLLCLTIVDVLRFSVGYYPAFSSKYLRPPSTSLAFLEKHTGTDRFLGVGGELPPETSVLYRLQDVRGYDALTPYRHYMMMGRIDGGIHNLLARLRAGRPDRTRWMPTTLFNLSLERYIGSTDTEMLDMLRHIDYWNSDVQQIESPNLLSIMGVRYMLCNAGNPLPKRTNMRLVHKSDAEIWENPDALPKAYITTAPIFAKNDAAALDLISDREFDFKRSAVICTSPRVSNEVHSDSEAGRLIPANILSYAPEKVQLAVDSPHGGWLILSDLYYPGWQASIDGTRTEIVPANYLFRAVHVQSGYHIVSFTYRPLSFYAGLVLSSLAIAALIGFGAWGSHRRKLTP
ncbi:MAG TPA: YfhO family protein [Acidobacteriota bacterium]|nr:YfhO family protein [Acidobacteriota bacterium]